MVPSTIKLYIPIEVLVTLFFSFLGVLSSLSVELGNDLGIHSGLRRSVLTHFPSKVNTRPIPPQLISISAAAAAVGGRARTRNNGVRGGD